MKNYWGLALTISVVFHFLLITGQAFIFKNLFKINDKPVKKEASREITLEPRKIENEPKKEIRDFSQPKPLPYTENILNKLIEKDNLYSFKKPEVFEKNSTQITFSETSRINKELKENPAYMNYYRLIRERIRTNTYQNYTSKNKGEVLVSFQVLKNGSLSKVALGGDSAKSKLLRSIALKSIEEAAPFPAFPEELNKYSHLQFNISIYFRNN